MNVAKLQGRKDYNQNESWKCIELTSRSCLALWSMLVILAFWRAAAGVQGQSGLKSETLSQKQNKKKYLRVWAVLFIYFFFLTNLLVFSTFIQNAF